MKPQQILVRGLRADGTLGGIDALELDKESFKAFVLDTLVRAGLLAPGAEDVSGLRVSQEAALGGASTVYRQRVGSTD